MAQQRLHIRFRGICTHIDMGGGSTSARKMRTVLVRGNHNDGIEHHLSFLEFLPDDLADGGLPADLEAVTFTRPGSVGLLARIDFNDTYEIRVNATKGYVEQDPFFKQSVPSLTEIVGELTVKPGLLRPNPQDVDSDLVTAVFDLPAGRIQPGEGEPELTRFAPAVGFAERYLARWSDLFVTIEDRPIVELLSLTGGANYTIFFKPTTQMITFGNEPESQIVGLLPGADDAARAAGHWPMFYTLIENHPPKETPVPIPKQLGGAGCPNNNLP
ncbi:MAG TPA: hypothetical protein VN181_14555 [Thermoanaerobaculia bacterium]|nr:hypothetical protein [Thermoanaerobaculia bacterium]